MVWDLGLRFRVRVRPYRLIYLLHSCEDRIVPKRVFIRVSYLFVFVFFFFFFFFFQFHFLNHHSKSWKCTPSKSTKCRRLKNSGHVYWGCTIPKSGPFGTNPLTKTSFCLTLHCMTKNGSPLPFVYLCSQFTNCLHVHL